MLHSHSYRHPSAYKDQTVAVLGAASSGLDICLDLAPHARQVFLSHWKDPVAAPLPDIIQQKKEIVSFEEDGVVFAGGERCRVDAVIFCTGYHYDFTFLSPECKTTVSGRRITPLHKHCIHTEFPTLAFIGITQQVLPFPHFAAQVKFVLAVWRGTLSLPSKTKMDEETEEDYQWRRNTKKFPHRYSHYMGAIMREYHRDLLDLAKEERFKPFVMDLYVEMYKIRAVNLMHYKELEFEVLDDKNFKIVGKNT